MKTVFFGMRNLDSFVRSMQGCIRQVQWGGIFTGDNLFTMGKNLSFLSDQRFMDTFDRHTETETEKAVIWRTYVLVWAAENGLRRPGDFVECGTYKGTSARVIADYVDFKGSGKKFYLYDLFEHAEGMNHHAMPEHGGDLYDLVRDRFHDLDTVLVTRGSVPRSLSATEPERIAFLHVDMNNAEAELGALETLFDRVSDGAFVVLDDYGWLCYRAQKLVEDDFFGRRGYRVLELPTGQGLVIK